MIFSPIPVTRVSVSRYSAILKAIYFKHYGAWYEPLYPEQHSEYIDHLEQLLTQAEMKLKGVRLLEVDMPESEFAAAVTTRRASLRKELAFFACKLLAGAGAAVFLHWFLSKQTHWNPYYAVCAAAASFVIVIVFLNVRNRGQLEAVKFFLAVTRDLFGR
jgi:hypothetical protein